MGLLTALVTLPLAPVRGVAWVAEQVAEEADRQLYDEASIRRDMLQLELDYEDGKIDLQEREHYEEQLLERLAISQARRAESEEEVRPWEEVRPSQQEVASPKEEVRPSEQEVASLKEEVQGDG